MLGLPGIGFADRRRESATTRDLRPALASGYFRFPLFRVRFRGGRLPGLSRPRYAVDCGAVSARGPEGQHLFFPVRFRRVGLPRRRFRRFGP